MRAVISSSAGFQSDMHLIVEQCVAQVREAAGLASFDDAVILPRTPALPKQPPPLPTKRPPPLPKEIESSNALLGLAPTMSWDQLAAQLPAATHPAATHPAAMHPAATHPAAMHPAATLTPRVLAPTVVRAAKKHAPVRSWPVLLCGFVAGVSAGAALIASPVGQRPAVHHVVVAAQAQASHVVASLRAAR